MTRVGYARVSSQGQSHDEQARRLAEQARTKIKAYEATRETRAIAN